MFCALSFSALVQVVSFSLAVSDQRVLEAITSNVLPSLLVSHTHKRTPPFFLSRRVLRQQGAISEDGDRVVENREAPERERKAKRTPEKMSTPKQYGNCACQEERSNMHSILC